MKNLLVLFMTLGILSATNAQERTSNFRIAWSVAIPTGSLSEYISQTSLRGASMEYNWKAKSNLEVGIESGWNLLYERMDDKVYTYETASVSGVQYRYTNTIPIIVGVKMLAKGKNSLTPYGGVGLGTVYINRNTDFGLYRITNNTWQFSVRPEVGLRFDYKNGMGFLLGAKYYANSSNDDLDGQSYIAINLGLVF
jgi:hypothetical protein